jgi:peptidyl-prolyl cis-trans isomerase D
MLKFFTRMERTRKYVVMLFAFLMVLGLVVAGVYTRPATVIANPFKSKEVLARVKGDAVTVADFTLLKKKIEGQFGGQLSLAQIGMTSDRILEQAINSRVSVQEAKRLGFTASEREVTDAIATQFAITSPEDVKRAQDYVDRNFGGVELYRESVRDALSSDKLRAFVSAGAQVSEAEVRDQFRRENTEFDVSYVTVSAEDVAKKIAPSDEELRQYFDAHKTDYRFHEPQKKIRYIYVNQEKVGQKLAIPDEELRKEYDSLKPENKMAGVRVQQIVLKVARPELDQEVMTKASGIVGRIRGEDLTADENAFAEQARGNSEDPATAQSGGWLPNPVKRNPNRKPGAPAASGNVAELLQDTLNWKEGQVGDPLKTGNAYYIFRRGPVVTKSFEDAKQELLVSLRNRRSYNVAQEIARKANDRLKETRDPQKVAQEFAAQANMTPAEMLKETSFIKPGDDVPDIGTSPQFEEKIQPLEEAGAVGDFVGVKNGFAIPQLVEKRDPRIPEFDEVKARVAEEFKRTRAAEQLEQAARDLAAGAGGVDALKAAAAKAGLTAEDEENFQLGRPLGKAGANAALDAAINQLKTGEGTKAPVKVGDKWVVVAVKERRDAKDEEFEKQKTELTERALSERRNQLFEDYLVEARRKLEEKGEIEIYRETLALVEESEPAALPRRPPINIVPPGSE